MSTQTGTKSKKAVSVSVSTSASTSGGGLSSSGRGVSSSSSSEVPIATSSIPTPSPTPIPSPSPTSTSTPTQIPPPLPSSSSSSLPEEKNNKNNEKKEETSETSQQQSYTLSENVEDRLKEELTCSICLEICIRPCTTPCGHNFCRRCLRGGMMYSFKCPKCRKKLSSRFKLNVNTVLWNTIQMLFPHVSNAPNSPTNENSENQQFRRPNNGNMYFGNSRDNSEYLNADIQSMVNVRDNSDMLTSTSIENLMLRLDMTGNSNDTWHPMHESTQERNGNSSYTDTYPLRARLSQRISPSRELSPLPRYTFYPRQRHSPSPSNTSLRGNFQYRSTNLRSHPTSNLPPTSSRITPESNRTPVLATAHVGPRSHPVTSSRRQRSLVVFPPVSNNDVESHVSDVLYDIYGADHMSRPFDMHPVEQSSLWNVRSENNMSNGHISRRRNNQREGNSNSNYRRHIINNRRHYNNNNNQEPQRTPDLRSHSIVNISDIHEEELSHYVDELFSDNYSRQDRPLDISRLSALSSSQQQQQQSQERSRLNAIRTEYDDFNVYRIIDDIEGTTNPLHNHHGNNNELMYASSTSSLSDGRHNSSSSSSSSSRRPPGISTRIMDHEMTTQGIMAHEINTRRPSLLRRDSIHSHFFNVLSERELIGRRDIDPPQHQNNQQNLNNQHQQEYLSSYTLNNNNNNRRHEPSSNDDPEYNSPMSFCSDEAESGSGGSHSSVIMDNRNEGLRNVMERRRFLGGIRNSGNSFSNSGSSGSSGSNNNNGNNYSNNNGNRATALLHHDPQRRLTATLIRNNERDTIQQQQQQQQQQHNRVYNHFYNFSSILEETMTNWERPSGGVPRTLQSRLNIPVSSPPTPHPISHSNDILPMTDDDDDDDDLTDEWEGHMSRYVAEGGEEYFSDSDDSFRALAFSDDADEDDSDIVTPFNFSNRQQQQRQSQSQIQTQQPNTSSSQTTSHRSRRQQSQAPWRT